MNSEQELIALSASLIGDLSRLTDSERALLATIGDSPPFDESDEAINQIRANNDILGDAFTRIRSQNARRQLGAVYTPHTIVASMCGWAANMHVQPARVVDPGAGSGRFLSAAAQLFPLSQLVAIESDPLAALMLRANAQVQGFADRLEVKVEDYCRIALPSIEGTTLFVGNPPYVRHHGIDESLKAWLAATARGMGVAASKLAGLHIYFFLKTLTLAKPGDFGAFITSSEWLDVNYGAILRILLQKQLGGTALHILDPTVSAFPGTDTTATITCFSVGKKNKALKVRQVPNMAALDGLDAGTDIPWNVVKKTNRWSTLIRPAMSIPAGHVELGELFRVHRGQVTGANNIWVTQTNPFGITGAYLIPTITRARELIAAGEVLDRNAHLKFVLDLPKDLDSLAADERGAVDAFIAWAKEHRAEESFVARNRQKWWSVGLREPAPIVCTYMARRAPAFVRNKVGARLLNIAHGLYPREPMSEQSLSAVVKWLRSNVRVESGRLYAGGLAKFEPKEVERLPVPNLKAMTEAALT